MSNKKNFIVGELEIIPIAGDKINSVSVHLYPRVKYNNKDVFNRIEELTERYLKYYNVNLPTLRHYFALQFAGNPYSRDEAPILTEEGKKNLRKFKKDYKLTNRNTPGLDLTIELLESLGI